MSWGLRIGYHGNDRGAAECGDCAVLTSEDETCWARARTVANDKAAAAIKNNASRISLLATSAGNRNRQRKGAGRNVVNRRLSGSIVGDPPGCRWTSH